MIDQKASVDLNQLRTAVAVIVNALEHSGLRKAIVEYSGDLSGSDSAAAEKVLMRTANTYMNYAAGYGAGELFVVKSLRLESLQSPGFWFDACAPTLSAVTRSNKLGQALSCLNFACEQFPKILEVLGAGEAGHAAGEEASVICVRIVDAADKASDPDRISRLIDGVDMIYRSCANLAGQPEGGLELISVRGDDGERTIVFHGHPEASTAARRIIGTLHQQASTRLNADNYSVELIAEQLPFMHAMDELYRVGALEAGFANEIRDGVLAGAIMLLECGARIYRSVGSTRVEWS